VDKADCSDQTDAEFPSPKMSYTQMMGYFQRQLGLTVEEVNAAERSSLIGEG
jgi:hypothetical protein